MGTRKFLAVVGTVAVALGLGLSACSGPTTNDAGTTTASAGGGATGQSGTVTVAWNQAMFSMNQNSSNGHATSNTNIGYLMQTQLGHFDENLNWIWNTKAVTVTKTSDDPLTVEYKLNPDMKWSDGQPVQAADMLLDWVALSQKYNQVDSSTVKRTDAGAAEVASGKVFFDAGDPNVALIKDVPTISDDGHTITMVYSKPAEAWQFAFTTFNLPAHVVAEKALDISDPVQATDALVKAIQTGDMASLAKIAQVWNTSFDMTSMPTDPSLVLSSGAYLLKNWSKDYLTLEANPAYTWGDIPKVKTIVVRFISDAMAQAQALANGEVNIIQPQATSDLLQALQSNTNASVTTIDGSTFEHVDLTFDNKNGPFNPATYGGDATKALEVRQAFLKTVPRQDIVDKIIKPLDPNATVRNSFLVTTADPNYTDLAAGNDSSNYGAVDIAGAKALLAKAGVKNPTVRIMYAKDNPRRVQEFQLISQSATQAGFVVKDVGSADWGSLLGNGSYDASIFGWQSVSTSINDNQATYVTGGQNNFSGYSNKTVDDAFSVLATSTDPAVVKQNALTIDKTLFDDGYGLTLYQFPEVTAFDKTKVTGVSDIAMAPTMFWDYWNWTATS